MLFEEFFKKKKISLEALQQGNPGLFLEFKTHYEQMGEKSFDHTKKYWFNKLRHEYPLPLEVKTEKVRMENQIAEQTVADTLTEDTPVEQNVKLGFKPKFKAAAPPKPATESTNKPEESTAQPITEAAPANEPPPVATAKPAYKPRFQAKSVAPKPSTESSAPEPAAESNVQPASEPTLESKPAPTPDTLVTEPAAPAPKLGFKPRFKTAAPAPESKEPESNAEQPTAESKEEQPVQTKSIATEQPNQEEKLEAPKPVYKPRFNPKMVKPKPPEED